MVDPAIACLDQVWSSIEELCSGFSTEDWRRPTDLPGWSVQDQLSHLCGIESKLLGHAQPPAIGKPWPPHVTNDLGALNEAQIQARRSLAPEDVLTEFMETTAERLKILSELSDQDLASETQGVLGKAPLRDVLTIRVVDCVYHEQDMRRATGNPGGLDTPAAHMVFERMRAALPMIAGKRAKLPEGTTVVIDVTGPVGDVTSIQVRDGRGVLLEAPPPNPITTMRLDLETFLCAAGGRWTPQQSSKRIVVGGVANVANAILGSMNMMP